MLRGIPSGTARLVLTSPDITWASPTKLRSHCPIIWRIQREVIAECVRITSDGGSICWEIGHHVNGHSQVIPLDIMLHPLFA